MLLEIFERINEATDFGNNHRIVTDSMKLNNIPKNNRTRFFR